MRKSKARKKSNHEKPALPLESGAVISYLKDLGISHEALLRVIGILEASLRKEEELLAQLEGVYGDYHRQLDRAREQNDPKFLDDASTDLRGMMEIRSDLDFEKQNAWILVAKESGRLELAHGVRGVPRHIAERKILADSSVESGGFEYARRQIVKSAVGLRRLRKERGLTLERVAKGTRCLFPLTTEAHVAAPHLHKAENAQALLSPLKLMALSQVYDVPFDVFLSVLALPELMPRMKEMARDLVLGVFGSLDEAKKDRDVTLQLEVRSLEDGIHRIETEKGALVRESESLKRQIEFLEAEVKRLRSAGR